jgi:hypothetical protein
MNTRFAQTLTDFNARDAAERASQANLDAMIIADMLDDEAELLTELLDDETEHEVLSDSAVFALTKAGLVDITDGDEDEDFATIELTPRGERIARKLVA